MAEKFVLVNIEDEKSKKLAEAISNKSCRRILGYLSEKESASEAEISKSLDIPISTVHYNIQILMENDMLESDEFRYSEKGREVDLYKLAKKLIIIAPKTTNKSDIKSRLKGIIPAIGLAAIGAGVIHMLNKPLMAAAPQAALRGGEAAKMMADEAVMAAAPAMEEAAVQEAVVEAAPAVWNAATSIWSNPALWFIVGGIFTLAVYLSYNLIRDRLKK